MPGKHPVQAIVPEIRNGSLSAVYYGQRRHGDFYDFVSVAPGKMLFGLFDVAGELQQARGVMVDLQRNFRNWGVKLLNNEHANETDSLIELWILSNRATMKSAGGVHACAAFFGCYDDQSGIVSYVNAGHTPGLVRHRQKVRQLEATALPFGLFPRLAPGASVMALNPGDALLLISKGVVEADYRGEEYGLQRAADCLDQSRIESAHEVCVGLLEQVRRFMRAPPTHDDVTALALVRSA
ncbi:MAG TPA: PP2C family protein-serine/threonine phosphatase [Terriglobales bacterium]|jgi:sigma-B regulation protein RsbU (phosphoserine phosphatase)|nr:PP2C family protein-serine/threonine phosphatase [Terriglobales bacterium]